MKSASSKDIKSALLDLEAPELTALCLRLARFKLENKELLTYLLFEAQDEDQFISYIKEEIVENFSNINDSNVYLLKKSLRKIIRRTEKYIRYSGKETTAAELYIELLKNLARFQSQLSKSTVLKNMYHALLKKLKKCIQDMHEDLQYDFNKSFEEIQIDI